MADNGMMVLDLGCGDRKVDGALGVDQFKVDGVDVVADLNHTNLPFRRNSVGTIHSRHVLEHVEDVVMTMQGMYRVLKIGGRLVLRLPHCSSHSIVWGDPTHKRAFALETLEMFCDGGRYNFIGQTKFKMVNRELHFALTFGRKDVKFINWIIDGIANLSPMMQRISERFVANYIGGFNELVIELEKTA